MSVASCRASQFGPPGGFFDARSIRGGILTRARSGWCRMRPIKGRQIGNVGSRPPPEMTKRLAFWTSGSVIIAPLRPPKPRGHHAEGSERPIPRKHGGRYHRVGVGPAHRQLRALRRMPRSVTRSPRVFDLPGAAAQAHRSRSDRNLQVHASGNDWFQTALEEGAGARGCRKGRQSSRAADAEAPPFYPGDETVTLRNGSACGRDRHVLHHMQRRDSVRLPCRDGMRVVLFRRVLLKSAAQP